MRSHGSELPSLASTTFHHLLTLGDSTTAQSEADAVLPRGHAELKLLFLHPKTLVDSWPVTVDTLGEIIKAPSAVYPVLASVVSDLPLQITMFDGYVTRESFANYKARLRQADVIAISMMSPLKALDTELSIRLAKALNPDVKIILGGNHASAFPERWIECGADFVVVGEGEVAFRKLMEAIVSRRSAFDDLQIWFIRIKRSSQATGIKPQGRPQPRARYRDGTCSTCAPMIWIGHQRVARLLEVSAVSAPLRLLQYQHVLEVPAGLQNRRAGLRRTRAVAPAWRAGIHLQTIALGSRHTKIVRRDDSPDLRCGSAHSYQGYRQPAP